MKNPYEESKSIEIPDDFLAEETKTTPSRVELHNVSKNDVENLNKDITNILNNSEKEQTFNFDYSEEKDKSLKTIIKEPGKIEPKIKVSSKKGYVVIGLTCTTIIFLVLSIILLFTNNGLRAELASIKENCENLTEQNVIYEAKISELETQVKEATNVDTSGNGTYYIVTASKIRTGAGLSFDTVSYTSLPSSIQQYASGDSKATTKEGATIPTISVVNNDGSIWGEIADGYWFCISYDGDVYAKVQ